MLFSKSFGYALRGILYVALMQDERRNIQVDEIAEQLNVPRHFMGKILKKLVKEKLLISIKGPNGGFSLHQRTLTAPLLVVLEITDGLSTLEDCVLRLNECNKQNPCPLHDSMVQMKTALREKLETTTIAQLLGDDKGNFLKSISSQIHLQTIPI
jgi:Rrf2 family protein